MSDFQLPVTRYALSGANVNSATRYFLIQHSEEIVHTNPPFLVPRE